MGGRGGGVSEVILAAYVRERLLSEGCLRLRFGGGAGCVGVF